jgi:hypothetical protein
MRAEKEIRELLKVELEAQKDGLDDYPENLATQGAIDVLYWVLGENSSPWGENSAPWGDWREERVDDPTN